MKTRLQIYQQTFLNKHDISVLLNVSRPTANRIYVIADMVDAELGDNRIEPYKVRFKTVMKVTHTDASLLLKQIKSTSLIGADDVPGIKPRRL